SDMPGAKQVKARPRIQHLHQELDAPTAALSGLCTQGVFDRARLFLPNTILRIPNRLKLEIAAANRSRNPAAGNNDHLRTGLPGTRTRNPGDCDQSQRLPSQAMSLELSDPVPHRKTPKADSGRQSGGTRLPSGYHQWAGFPVTGRPSPGSGPPDRRA